MLRNLELWARLPLLLKDRVTSVIKQMLPAARQTLPCLDKLVKNQTLVQQASKSWTEWTNLSLTILLDKIPLITHKTKCPIKETPCRAKGRWFKYTQEIKIKFTIRQISKPREPRMQFTKELEAHIIINNLEIRWATSPNQKTSNVPLFTYLEEVLV